jgi:hypothetical protein
VKVTDDDDRICPNVTTSMETMGNSEGWKDGRADVLHLYCGAEVVIRVCAVGQLTGFTLKQQDSFTKLAFTNIMDSHKFRIPLPY